MSKKIAIEVKDKSEKLVSKPASCLNFVIKALEKLPKPDQPEHVDYVLKSIIHGGQVWNSIQKNKFYDACNPQNISSQGDIKYLKIALNTTDDMFWKQVLHDELLQQEIKKIGIAFTKEECLSLRYNIFIRMAYLRQHVKDVDVFKHLKVAYQQALISLNWYLFGQALLQEPPFTSAMITLNDKKHLIFNFISGYAELVSPGYGFYSGLHPYSLWASEAYTRKSRHWSGYKEFDDNAFGIDLKNDKEEEFKAFPGNNAHLLFGVLTNGLLFIKWQRHGITINFYQNDFSALRYIKDFFSTKTIEDSNVLERIEKIPQDVKYMFKSLYKQNSHVKNNVDCVHTYGISQMLKHLDLEAKSIFMDFLVKRKHYASETMHLRKGDEIILQSSKFVSFTEPHCRLVSV